MNSKNLQQTATLTVKQLLLESPLYALVPMSINLDAKPETDETSNELMLALRSKVIQLDAHCIECNQSSTFKSVAPYRITYVPPSWLAFNYFEIVVSCQRNERHHYIYYFSLTQKGLIKIGQMPSLEDIASSDLARFRGVLSKEDFSELHRAGGLFSHGIGIGSFVYLRRIFERLILHTKEEAQKSGCVTEKFSRLRMDEKIGALSAYLPAALVKHKAIYGILSKGIHELDEEACKKYFPVVKAAIIDILEQALEKKNRKKAEDELERAISLISVELNTTNLPKTGDES